VGKLKTIHIMCKRDTESAKVASESVLSNRGNLEGTNSTRFSPVGYLEGGLSPKGVISAHHLAHPIATTPVNTTAVISEYSSSGHNV